MIWVKCRERHRLAQVIQQECSRGVRSQVHGFPAAAAVVVGLETWVCAPPKSRCLQRRSSLPASCRWLSYPLWAVLGSGKREERPCWDLPAFSTLLPPHLTLGIGKYIPEWEFSRGVWLSEREHPASHQFVQTPPLPVGGSVEEVAGAGQADQPSSHSLAWSSLLSVPSEAFPQL